MRRKKACGDDVILHINTRTKLLVM